MKGEMVVITSYGPDWVVRSLCDEWRGTYESRSWTSPEIPCVRFSLRRIFSRRSVDSGVFLSQGKESGRGLKKRYDKKDPSDDFLCSAG